LKLIVEPAASPLAGRVAPPGDKSVSHRAAILGGLAHGTTRIEGFLTAEDTLATLGAMADLGARVRRDGTSVEIEGGALRAPARALDLGNSGTGMRLLTGALCGHPDLFGASIELCGDASLSRRPMKRIVDPLGAMGAVIESREGRAPLVVRPRRLQAMVHRLNVASAQVKSAILLAGLNAHGRTEVTEPGLSRDHTERLLPAFGVDVERADPGTGTGTGTRAGITGPTRLEAARFSVPGDLSSAAFMLAASLLVPRSRVEVGPTGVNPTRDGFLRIVERMAGSAVLRHPMGRGGSDAEPVAMLEAAAPDRLVGIDVPQAWVPLAIDEFPLVMAMAAVAEGKTVITGAEELRVKESDRLAVMSRELGRLGVRVEEYADGATVYGGRVQGGTVDSGGDHRIAMSLAVLALVAEAPVEITDAEWIRTSYPAFVEHLEGLGARLQWR
jgi:3-phosphoshikimate 1-carboxyvinyltransferase